ncbi:MAG: bifunctional DNA-formamidopyrimidine glycosylase/DNA-(apurinic or apyrimidinic site) lyase [Planctomycetota bacterium]
MPELPEIEHLRRSLEPLLVEARVHDVRLARPAIVRTRRPRPSRHALLLGQRVTRLHRHGKQLAVETADGPVLCVHLGMSGQLHFAPARQRLPRTDHVHCVWRIDSPAGRGRLVFRDPRRFGGLWLYESIDDLRRERWSGLGPDALSITPAVLHQHLARTRRAIKAALLDQAVIAGIGNIYADEALFHARIHPLSPASALPRAAATGLAGAIRRTLRRAIDAGGSTIRDYADATGAAGRYGAQHLVYGRGGAPCRRCGAVLDRFLVAQRTTVCCRRCQSRHR